ncbi:MAG: hypothetical protein WC860_00225 [Candidatus Margulisiibacteriota bacterium]|jgi:hypothetical protein
MKNTKQVKFYLIIFFVIIFISIVIILMNIFTISLNEKNIELKKATKELIENNNALYFEILEKTNLSNLEIEAKKLGLVPLININYINKNEN